MEAVNPIDTEMVDLGGIELEVEAEADNLFENIFNEKEDTRFDKLKEKYGSEFLLTQLPELLKEYDASKQVDFGLSAQATVKNQRRFEKSVAQNMDNWAEEEAQLDLFEAITDPEVLQRQNGYPYTYQGVEGSDVPTRCEVGKISLEEAYTWDFVLVFKVGEPTPKVEEAAVDKPELLDIRFRSRPGEFGLYANADEMSQQKDPPTMIKKTDLFAKRIAFCVGAIRAAGLKTKLYYSTDKDEIYCLVGAPETLLREFASVTGAVMCEIHPQKLKEMGGTYGLGLCQVEEAFEKEIEPIWKQIMYTPFRDFESIGDERADMFVKKDYGGYHKDTYFHPVERIKLTLALMQAEYAFGGCNLPLKRFRFYPDHPLVAYYPLHDPIFKEELERESKRCGAPLFTPSVIKDYYGEHIGYYFEFLAFYTWWLMLPALLGIPVFVYQVIAIFVNLEPPNGGLMLAFGFLVVVWSTCFLEAWKRHEKKLSVRWGMYAFAEQEVARPEFEGEWKVSKITGEIDEVFPYNSYLSRLIRSNTVVLGMICVVLGLFVSIIFLRKLLVRSAELGTSNSLLVASAINAIQILVMNQIFQRVAKALNDWENHRTETQYQNNLINKSFWFKIVNLYSSMLYISFGKSSDANLGYCKGSWLLNSDFKGSPMTTEAKCCLPAWEEKFGSIASRSSSVMPSLATFLDFCCSSFCPENSPNTSFIGAPACYNSYDDAQEHPLETNCDNICVDRRYTYAELNADGIQKVKDILLWRGSDFRGDCFAELFIQLAVVFLMSMIVNNTQEVFLPWLFGRLAARREGLKKSDIQEMADGVKRLVNDGEEPKPIPSKAEEEYVKSNYEGTLADYDELVAQFGYVVLFVMAFPLAPFLALTNNLLEFQVDIHKLLILFRRPLPAGAMNIGAWYSKFEALSWMCIITNVALIFFTARSQDFNFDSYLLFVYYLVIEHCLFAVKLFAAFLIPDTPLDIQEQIDRSNFIKLTVFDDK